MNSSGRSCGCLKIIRRHESSDLLFEKVEARVAVREVQFAARRQHRYDDISPNPDIRQPADRPPRREDQIERARREFRGLVDSPFDEFGLQPGLLCEASRDAQGYAREIQPGGHGAAPHEAERVAARYGIADAGHAFPQRRRVPRLRSRGARPRRDGSGRRLRRCRGDDPRAGAERGD